MELTVAEFETSHFLTIIYTQKYKNIESGPDLSELCTSFLLCVYMRSSLLPSSSALNQVQFRTPCACVCVCVEGGSIAICLQLHRSNTTEKDQSTPQAGLELKFYDRSLRFQFNAGNRTRWDYEIVVEHSDLDSQMEFSMTSHELNN